MQGTASFDTGKIEEGDRVHVQSLDRDGVVESLRDGSYVVTIGLLRYHADRADLTKISGSKAGSVSSSHSFISDAPEEACSELKVIGLTADEALDRVDKFLDQAYLAGVESVREKRARQILWPSLPKTGTRIQASRGTHSGEQNRK